MTHYSDQLRRSSEFFVKLLNRIDEHGRADPTIKGRVGARIRAYYDELSCTGTSTVAPLGHYFLI
jgi:hypothetical protein